MPSASTSEPLLNDLLLPPERFARWVENFSIRHGETALVATPTGVAGSATDGSTFEVALPWSRGYTGDASVSALLDAVWAPPDWGVLLVRRGGYAIARLVGSTVVATKVGRRHVQGRTKAGGQSQQRFARRRENQARQAYEAAATHAVEVLGRTRLLVVGGDRGALDRVLADPRLLRIEVVGRVLEVPGDPRRQELDAAVEQAGSLSVRVFNR